MFKRQGSAVWRGAGPTGGGELTTTSGVLKGVPYSAKARFQSPEGRDGTNPEELIAAAHAGCFSMALAFQLSNNGFEATELATTAEISMEKGASGWAMTGIVLRLNAKIPKIDQAKFKELAETAKANCPVSKALAAVPIALEATLG